MDSPERDYAQVGDTIEITYEGRWSCGKQFVVIPAPLEIISDRTSQGHAWVKEYGSAHCIRFGDYKIVKKSEIKQDTKSVEASLRKQLDANLRSVFGQKGV